jgi:hypothetical protein
MKLSIFQAAMLIGWYQRFTQIQRDDIASMFVEIGNLASAADSIYPDASPKPSELPPADFIRFVVAEVPKLIEANTASLREFVEVGATFGTAIAGAMQKLKAPA